MTERGIDSAELAASAVSPELRLAKTRLLSGGAWAITGRVLAALSGLIVSAFLARLLTPSDLGVYFLVQSLVALGSTLSLVGMDKTVVRFVAGAMGVEAEPRARAALARSALLALGGTLLTATILAMATPILGRRLFDSPGLAAVPLLTAAWCAVQAGNNFVAEGFRALHDIRFATIFGGLVSGFILLAALAFLIPARPIPIEWVLWAMIGSFLGSMASGGMLLLKRARRFRSVAQGEAGGLVTFSELAHSGAPLLITAVMLYSLAHADLWIAGANLPDSDVALYGAAARLVAMVAMPLTLVRLVLPPMIAEFHAQGQLKAMESVLRTTATITALPALLVLLIFVFAGAPVLGVVFGAEYRQAAPVLLFLSLGQAANVWAGSCGVTMAMTGHERYSMVVAMLSGTIAIVSGIWAVGRFGLFGLAAATMGAVVLQQIMMVILVRAKVGVWTHMEWAAFGRLRTLFLRS